MYVTFHWEPSTSAVTVNYTMTGTATAGTDYTISGGTQNYTDGTGTFTIPAGTEPYDFVTAFTVIPTPDNIQDSGETIILTLVDGTGYHLTGDISRTITLLDNSGEATFEVSGNPWVGETLTLTRTANDPDGNGTEDGTWFWGWQKRTLGGGWSKVLIGAPPAGRFTGKQYVVRADDLGMQLRGQIYYTDGIGLSRTVFTSPVGPVILPGLEISGDTSSPYTGDTGRYTVKLVTQPTGEVTVGIASDNENVKIKPTSLTFTTSNWSNPQTVTVSAKNTDGAPDSATLTHNASGGGYGSVTESFRVTFTFTDTIGPTPTLPAASFASGSSSAAESAGTHNVRVNLSSAAPSSGLTIGYSVAGTATAGSGNDFTIQNSGTLSVAARATSATIPVAIIDDGTQENAETVILTLTSGGTGYTLGSTTVHTLTITDNDDPPPSGTPGLVISRSTLGVSEGGTGNYTVKLQTAPTGTVTVAIVSNNTDVTVRPSSLTFNANGSNLWNTAQTVTVSAAQDNDDVHDSARLTHTALGGGYGSLTATLDVTVTDNETRSSSKDDEETKPPPPPTTPNTGTDNEGVPASPPVISISGGVGAEEGEVLLYSIISEEPVEQDTEVKIKVEQRGEYTEPVESTVTIKTGEKEAVYEVTTTDDSIDEEDGEVTVTVLSGTGYEVGTSSSVTLEVRDNDNAGIKVSEAKLSVSGEGGRVSYTVVLTSEPVLEVRVEPYSQNSSVAVVSGALVFTKENWDREQTVTVRGKESGSTVIEHRISSGDNTYSSVKTENVEVRVEDKKKEEGAGEWTGRFGRTVAERVVEAVSRRMEGERESRVEIAGVHPVEKRPESIWGEQEQESISLEEVLLASSFEVGRKGSAAFWAKASRSSFEGRREGWSGDGDVTMGVGGADWSTESMLGGLMIIRADGSGDYGGSSIDAHITGVAPYAGGKISDYMSIWGTVGVGRGEIRVREEEERWSSDIGWKMAAGGIRGEIVTRKTEGLGLAFVSDVLWAKSDSEDYFEEGVSRIRAGVEGSWIARLSESALFEPRVEAGLRRDGGDAERGIGAELGGGLKLRHTELGITFDIEGRGLVSHEDGGFESRGISASFEWAKDMSEGRGASVALRQDWGEPESGGMESLFYDGPIRGGEVSSNGSRLSAEAEYGFMREGMRQAPYVDYGQWEEGRDYALGWRVSTISSDVSVDLNATRRESEQTDTEHGVGVRLDVRW